MAATGIERERMHAGVGCVGGELTASERVQRRARRFDGLSKREDGGPRERRSRHCVEAKVREARGERRRRCAASGGR